MEEAKIISHEIGHGIISYLFNEEYFSFEGIKLNPHEVFNTSDLAYTISKPVENIDDKVNQSNHLAAAIDGLSLLAGIAGMTVFLSDNLERFNIDATLANYTEYFDFEGSEGDFEIITHANRPYGWYLFKAGKMTEAEAWIRHIRILNLLKNLFRENVFQESFKELKQKLIDKRELVLQDFYDSLDQEVVKEKKEEIKAYIKSGLGKPLLVE